MRKFLACYDYGMGGLWWWIEAESTAAINATFRDLTVFDEPPAWWASRGDWEPENFSLGDVPDHVLGRFLRDRSA
jgi:hypothetical protein